MLHGDPPFRYSSTLQSIKSFRVSGENFSLRRIGDICARLDAGNILEILGPLAFVGIVGCEKNVILAEQLQYVGQSAFLGFQRNLDRPAFDIFTGRALSRGAHFLPRLSKSSSSRSIINGIQPQPASR